MSGEQLRETRERLGLTQQAAARKWRLSQTYVSFLERDKRPVPARLARLLAREDPRLATALPVRARATQVNELPETLGALGYERFSYLGDSQKLANPAAVVLDALKAPVLESRVTEALPWVLVSFSDLDWAWLVAEAKLANLQNRLGFLVSLARQVAERKGDVEAARVLAKAEGALEEARLAKEDSLGRDLTDAERVFLREHRLPLAAHWNLLTSLQLDQLRYAS
jgi:transcriptional regulator with XRE-family HTH domain